MVQNLKVDIIYHLTASDFEMEFNLCGCCRMRLLSDKTTDKKSFVKALARDVARSRVIMVCGPLFGADGIISTVATAIGNGTAVCDNKTYGINGNEQIHIINGSTPLVTPDGYFGGCIIESGPQTIILLTENKAFRKSIMQNLIHPYIEEISFIPSKTAPLSPTVEEAVTAPVADDADLYLTEPDEYEKEDEIVAEEVLPTTENDHNVEFIMDDDSDNSTETNDSTPNENEVFDDSYKLMFTEIESSADIKSRYSEPYMPSAGDDMFITERRDDSYETRRKKDNNLRAMDITIVALFLLLILSVLAIVYLLVLRPVSMGVDVSEYVKEIFGLATNSTLV